MYLDDTEKNRRPWHGYCGILVSENEHQFQSFEWSGPTSEFLLTVQQVQPEWRKRLRQNMAQITKTTAPLQVLLWEDYNELAFSGHDEGKGF